MKLYTCNNCNETIKGKLNYNTHIKSCIKNKYTIENDNRISIYVCHLCNKKYKRSSNFNKHCNKMHGENINENNISLDKLGKQIIKMDNEIDDKISKDTIVCDTIESITFDFTTSNPKSNNSKISPYIVAVEFPKIIKERRVNELYPNCKNIYVLHDNGIYVVHSDGQEWTAYELTRQLLPDTQI